MLNIEKNDKLGFYQLGEEKFHNKVQALIQGTQRNQFPEWNFNRATFDNVNWLEEPEANLLELYRIRAQQIREKYDYVRLEF